MSAFLLLGCGYTLRRVGRLLNEANCTVTATSNANVMRLQQLGFRALCVRAEEGLGIDLRKTQLLVDGIPPQDQSTARQATRNIISFAQQNRIGKVIYLSTTGVYGVTDGTEVSESSDVRASSPSGLLRKQVETWYRESGLEVLVLRIPAIYGPGRGIGTALRMGSYTLIGDGSDWGNRVQVDDLARIIHQACLRFLEGKLPPALNACDDEPARACDVVEFYCRSFGLERPNSIAREEALRRGMHTRLSSQRVSNRLLKQTLEIQLRYPSYREGAETEFLIDPFV